MTEKEMLQLILSEIQSMRSEMKDMKFEMQDMKTDIQNIKSEIQRINVRLDAVEARLDIIESDVKKLKEDVVRIQLHMENFTDKGIQLIAENFVELTKKLNQAIPVADKNLAYEVKVNYLAEEMAKLKVKVKALEEKIA